MTAHGRAVGRPGGSRRALALSPEQGGATAFR